MWVPLARPWITTPATPNEIASTAPACRPRYDSISSSNEPNSVLLCDSGSIGGPTRPGPTRLKRARLIFVPPMSPARITRRVVEPGSGRGRDRARVFGLAAMGECGGPLSDDGHHLVEGPRERADAVVQELLGVLLDRDAGIGQRVAGLARGVETGIEAVSGGRAVVEIRVERLPRHRVDAVLARQLLDVLDVGVGRVLGPGARPEDPLWPGALRAKRSEDGAEELRPVLLPDIERVRHGGCSAERQVPLPSRGVRRGGGARLQRLVDRRVEAAHEDARDRVER